MDSEDSKKALPQIVLFGDSLTEWSFSSSTQGFGWHLTNLYRGRAEIVNQGYAGYLSNAFLSHGADSLPSYTSEDVKIEFSRLIPKITSPTTPKTLFFTIFLGANDACFVGNREYVPLPDFLDNISAFVEEILIQDELTEAKIILITPPPINVPEPIPDDDEDLGPAMAAARKGMDPKKDRGYVTYMSKKCYADAIMSLAEEYEETGRVMGLDFWRALVNAGLEEQGRAEEKDEDKLPGCGLHGAKEFGRGWFTDGLHLDRKAYNVLSKVLTDAVIGKWPELAPDNVGA